MYSWEKIISGNAEDSLRRHLVTSSTALWIILVSYMAVFAGFVDCVRIGVKVRVQISTVWKYQV